MKRIPHYYKFILSGLSLLSLLACKKYGYIFEDGWGQGSKDSTGVSVDTSGFEIDKSMYDKARIFPGLVDSTERRIQDTTIIFNFDYTYVAPAQLGFGAVPQPIFSSGLYAGPGELVEVTVPEGVNMLTAQIGIHTDDLTALSPRKREPLIVSVTKLFPGINKLRNPFGGYIWIKSAFPGGASTKLVFKGAIQAPDFVLGSSDVLTWQKEAMASKVPWLELRSKRIVFSVSREWIQRGIEDGTLGPIDQTLQEWDRIIEDDFYKFNGMVDHSNNLSIRMPELPERAVMDIQLTGGVYAHSGGQPLFVLNDAYWFKEWTDIRTLEAGESVGTFNQFGVNYQLSKSPWWAGMTETVPKLVLYKTASRNGIVPDILDDYGVHEMFPQALAYAAKDSGKYLDGDIESASYPMFKLLPLVQIFEKVTKAGTGEDGWGFYPFLISKAKNATSLGTDDMSRRNFVYTALCEWGQKDFASFFDFWGIPIGDYYRDLMSKTYPPLDIALWEYNPITHSGGNRHYVEQRIFYPRTSWDVYANTADVEGGGTPSLTDGNPTTYWHTCYKDPCFVPGTNKAPGPPYIILFDMGQKNVVNGFFVASRMGLRRPKSVEISISDDGETWESLGTFALENRNNNQYITLPQAKQFQHFRLTMNEPLSYDEDVNNAIAEVGAFRLR